MNFDPSSPLDTAHFSAAGPCPVLVLAADAVAPDGIQAVKIGIDGDGSIQCSNPDAFDILLTTHADAPAPWITIANGSVDAQVAALADRVQQWPVAATTLAQVLRIGEKLPFNDALQVESLAYSTLLGGAEFARWLDSRTPSPDSGDLPKELVRYERDGDHVTLTLNNPQQDNAMTAAMRDALYGALANVLDDPTRPTITIFGAGRSFSTGGHLPEFGSADDLAKAHVIRTVHGCARLIHQLGGRATVRFHGAAIGSGLEVPAAAARREATPDAWFQLPELAMGLIPGAGGTVSVSRTIGRHRTMWMAISGRRVNAKQALALGLVQVIVEP
ncbi:MAG: enoyl-CoA hydratase/isomerase family protein [Sphingomonadaceae bacterium]|nr:enoyl-CoA hydratase/isomerase family protein [Sphingomonadaceae bacterium]